MSPEKLVARLRRARERHGDVAIRILSRDFPRWHLGGGMTPLLVLLAVFLMTAPAWAGRDVAARARVLAGAAGPGPERVRQLLREESQGRPAKAEFEQLTSTSEAEIYLDGAWIRLSSAPNAESGAERRISVVYLGN